MIICVQVTQVNYKRTELLSGYTELDASLTYYFSDHFKSGKLTDCHQNSTTRDFVHSS